MSTSSPPPNSPSSPLPPKTLTTLPGELRNQIFTLCIDHALSHPFPLPPLASHPLTVTVYTPRHKTGHLLLSHIIPPPLLFTNRQTYAEVLSLIYARVSHVSLGEKVSVWLDEDAVSRWNFAFSLIERRADVMKMAKSIEVVLPRTPCQPLSAAYASLSKSKSKATTDALSPRYPENNALAVLPYLTGFLAKFESLEKVKIILIAESKDQIPAYEDFTGLWSLFGEGLKLEFKTRRMKRGDPRGVDPLAWLHREWWVWKDGWMRFVRGLDGGGRISWEKYGSGLGVGMGYDAHPIFRSMELRRRAR